MAIQTIIRNQPRKARFPDGFRVMQGQQEFITYPDHSSIRVWPSDQSGRFDSHFHSAVEIIMPSQGVSVCRLSDREYRVKADEILIIPANTMHELAEEDDILRYLILFEPAPLFSLVDMQQAYPIAQHPIYLQAPSETHREIAELLHELVDCYFQQKPMWNTRCYACLLQVYALLAEEYAAATASPAEEDRRLIDPQIMNMAGRNLAGAGCRLHRLFPVLFFPGLQELLRYFLLRLSDGQTGQRSRQSPGQHGQTCRRDRHGGGFRQYRHLQPRLPESEKLYSHPLPDPVRAPEKR